MSLLQRVRGVSDKYLKNLPKVVRWTRAVGGHHSLRAIKDPYVIANQERSNWLKLVVEYHLSRQIILAADASRKAWRRRRRMCLPCTAQPTKATNRCHPTQTLSTSCLLWPQSHGYAPPAPAYLVEMDRRSAASRCGPSDAPSSLVVRKMPGWCKLRAQTPPRSSQLSDLSGRK